MQEQILSPQAEPHRSRTMNRTLGVAGLTLLLATMATHATPVTYDVILQDSISRSGGTGKLVAEVSGNPLTSSILSFKRVLRKFLQSLLNQDSAPKNMGVCFVADELGSQR